MRDKRGPAILALHRPESDDLLVVLEGPGEIRHLQAHPPHSRAIRQPVSGRTDAVLASHARIISFALSTMVARAPEYNHCVRHRSLADPLIELPSGEPANSRERWRAAIYIGTALGLAALVVLSVVFEYFAATGVLLIVFLSFVVTYLIAPGVERIRHASASARQGRPISRSVAVLAIYGAIAAAVLPFWVFGGDRFAPALERMTALVPQHTTRFVDHLRAGEGWADSLRLPAAAQRAVTGVTRAVSRSVQTETRAIEAELVGIRRLVPWLSLVPVVAFVLLTRWTRFRRSTTRVLPTPHLQWRGNEFLRNVNSLLASYTRAQAMSGLIVGFLCWCGFAALGLPYPGTLALTAGLLEMIPLAGPLIVAVVATAVMPERVVPVLAFLAALRVVQDYLIYPRLISRAMKLHPLAVVCALWAGAALGGLVGVCLAIPAVGMLQVTLRHWREYREIETLVDEAIRRSTA
jgi:predicted PurR-regulated permease PerM